MKDKTNKKRELYGIHEPTVYDIVHLIYVIVLKDTVVCKTCGKLLVLRRACIRTEQALPEYLIKKFHQVGLLHGFTLNLMIWQIRIFAWFQEFNFLIIKHSLPGKYLWQNDTNSKSRGKSAVKYLRHIFAVLICNFSGMISTLSTWKFQNAFRNCN